MHAFIVMNVEHGKMIADRVLQSDGEREKKRSLKYLSHFSQH